MTQVPKSLRNPWGVFVGGSRGLCSGEMTATGKNIGLYHQRTGDSKQEKRERPGYKMRSNNFFLPLQDL